MGRILNAMWMICAWSLISLRRKNRPDVMLMGTDPIISVLVSMPWKIFAPKVVIAHWCYDVYPEAAIADGIFKENSLLVIIIKSLLKSAYKACDIIVDIGICMRGLIEKYGHKARKLTLVPWALLEPEEVLKPEPKVRKELFGDASLGIMYSGNFGRAHSYEEILSLARTLRGEDVHFSFGVRGNNVTALKNAVLKDDINISFAGFSPESELVKRLAAADIHLVSLRSGWTGVVVPSKFFGCLAAGRPVIFEGSRKSAIAKWIDAFKVGWVLDRSSLESVANEIKTLIKSKEKLLELQQRCFKVYHEKFSKSKIMDRWNLELRSLLRSNSESQSNLPGK